jgi:hypothetical protein
VPDRAVVVGVFLGLAADDGHAEWVGDQFGAHVVGDRPANDQRPSPATSSGLGCSRRGSWNQSWTQLHDTAATADTDDPAKALVGHQRHHSA